MDAGSEGACSGARAGGVSNRCGEARPGLDPKRWRECYCGGCICCCVCCCCRCAWFLQTRAPSRALAAHTASLRMGAARAMTMATTAR